MGMLLMLMLICPFLPSNPSTLLLLGVPFRTRARLGIGRRGWKDSVRLLALLLEGRVLGFLPNVGHLVQIWTMGSSFPFSNYCISNSIKFDVGNGSFLKDDGDEMVVFYWE